MSSLTSGTYPLRYWGKVMFKSKMFPKLLAHSTWALWRNLRIKVQSFRRNEQSVTEPKNSFSWTCLSIRISLCLHLTTNKQMSKTKQNKTNKKKIGCVTFWRNQCFFIRYFLWMCVFSPLSSQMCKMIRVGKRHNEQSMTTDIYRPYHSQMCQLTHVEKSIP